VQCIALRYSGERYRVLPTGGDHAPRRGSHQESDMTSRLDRWADPPLLVLASLADEPKHGYAITRDVAESMGVTLGAGTLYAVISRLEAQGLIEPLDAVDRRRPYRITAAGAEALAQQSSRMSSVASLAQARLRSRLGMAGA
jgi:DNA-binding PadR family transcriptional regulator